MPLYPPCPGGLAFLPQVRYNSVTVTAGPDSPEAHGREADDQRVYRPPPSPFRRADRGPFYLSSGVCYAPCGPPVRWPGERRGVRPWLRPAPPDPPLAQGGAPHSEPDPLPHVPPWPDRQRDRLHRLGRNEARGNRPRHPCHAVFHGCRHPLRRRGGGQRGWTAPVCGHLHPEKALGAHPPPISPAPCIFSPAMYNISVKKLFQQKDGSI